MKKILLQMQNPMFEKGAILKNKDANNAFERWRMLKEKLNLLGFELMTADNNNLNDCEGIIFHDATSLYRKDSLKIGIKKIIKIKVEPKYPARDLYKEAIDAGLRNKIILLMWDAKVACPLNFDISIWEKFDRILTWNDDFLENPKFIRYCMPMETHETTYKIIPFKEKKFLTNISFNKYSNYKNELYKERRKSIEYFDRNYPDDFDLYGPRWNRPITRMQLMFPRLAKKFSTYKGHSKDKIDTLSHYKFNICYENISDANGYITEKIFDSLKAGTVPVYWGAPNIEKYVDKDVFIDRRKFKTNAELANFLNKITEEEYDMYLKSADRYMKSEKYSKFLPEQFCDIIINALNLKK